MNKEVALRREARRKKILENSVSRLKLIEGINSPFEKSTFHSTEPQTKTFENIKNFEFPKKESNLKLSDLIEDHKELKEISDFLSQSNKQEREEETDDDVEVENEDREEQVVGSKMENWLFRFIFEKRLHYVLLAVLVHLMLLLDLGYLFYESIFCPFYTVKIIELISRKGEKGEFQPIYFLLLAGLPKGLQKFVKNFIGVVTALFSDLLLYIFVFILGTKAVNKQL